MVEKMLDGVEVELGVDYLARKAELDKLADQSRLHRPGGRLL